MDFFSAAGVSKGIDVGQQIYQNEFNAREAADARDWAGEMRGTAYQATVRDLMKAGLNPMLAYGRGPNAAPGAPHASGSAFGESYASARERSANVALKDAETRNVSAEARRNEQIADILEKIGPRIVQGVGAIESAAGSVGAGVGRAVEAIERFLRDFKGPNLPSIPSIIEGVRDMLPDVTKMPPAVLYREVKEAVDKRSRTPSPATPAPFGTSAYRNVWGLSEYERAQQERFNRARQSPASRRRQGGGS